MEKQGTRGFLVIVVFVSIFGATNGCDNEESESAGSVAVGSTCTEADNTADREVCNGTRVLECKLDGGAYLWKIKKDCTDTNRVCSNGDCVSAQPGACKDPAPKFKAYCNEDSDCGKPYSCMKPCPSCDKTCNLPCGGDLGGDAYCASYGAGTCGPKNCSMCFSVCKLAATRCEPL